MFNKQLQLNLDCNRKASFLSEVQLYDPLRGHQNIYFVIIDYFMKGKE